MPTVFKIQRPVKFISPRILGTRDRILEIFANSVSTVTPWNSVFNFTSKNNNINWQSRETPCTACWIATHSWAQYQKASACYTTWSSWTSAPTSSRGLFPVRSVTWRRSQKCTTTRARDQQLVLSVLQRRFSSITRLFSYALETFTPIGWTALSLLSLASWEASLSYGWATTALQALFLQVMIPTCK